MPFLRFHTRIALLNLSLLAFIGVLMRLKIAFAFPWLQQKFLLHAHSHFAFSGWVSHMLMLLLLQLLPVSVTAFQQLAFRRLLLANLLCAYGMLFSFAMQGYGAFSIAFSAGSIAVSYCFAIVYWRASKPAIDTASAWARAAVCFNAFSSIGVWLLAWLMFHHVDAQQFYLGAVLYFLHFQYNGWFFFGCLALFFSLRPMATFSKRSLYGLILCAVLSFPLSVPWPHKPAWLQATAAAAAIVQLWLFYRMLVLPVKLQDKKLRFVSLLLRAALLAFLLKMILQVLQGIPFFAQLSFSSRPLIIGYLHLVLLLGVSFLLLGYVFLSGVLPLSRICRMGLFIFSGGAVLNECLLAAQAAAGFWLIALPGIQVWLFAAAMILFSGSMVLFFGSLQKMRTSIKH